MKIKITSATAISEIQQQLSSVYPFLMVKFSNKPLKKDGRKHGGYWYEDNFQIASVATKGIPGTIIIRPWHETGDVEQEFSSKFGLHAQLFRKEGEQWIETAGTDVFTISEQNETGSQMTSEHPTTPIIDKEKLL